jgi:hypothetical protein
MPTDTPIWRRAIAIKFAAPVSLFLFFSATANTVGPDKDGDGRHLLPCKLRFPLSASLPVSLRLFEIVPVDFIAVFCLARHPPERFSTNG